MNKLIALTESISEVNEDHIRQYLVTIPPTKYNNMASFPETAGVPHSRLGRCLALINLGGEPFQFFYNRRDQVSKYKY